MLQYRCKCSDFSGNEDKKRGRSIQLNKTTDAFLFIISTDYINRLSFNLLKFPEFTSKQIY